MSTCTLITGGAGFIGINYAARLLSRGDQVVIFDNLSRIGTPGNIEWLKNTFGEDSFQLIVGDVRENKEVNSAVQQADLVLHLAAQVAVTTSVEDPRTDFEINALGTLNVLEAARLSSKKPPVIYSSTNKVYGDLEDVKVSEGEDSYYFPNHPEGIGETQILDFHSPYGCSKGAGDQYVRDYHRIFSLPTVVFRQSCIYGPHQFGIEDQGWVAWFVIAAITGRPIGGGKDNTLSIWKEFGPLLEKELGQKIPVSWQTWRSGDQRVFIADINKAKQDFGWEPEIDVETGIQKLFDWVRSNQNLF